MRISRRDVLSGLSVIGLSAGLLGGRRTARASTDDYRALVCVFLYGGNDGNNMVVPVDARYDDYLAARRPQTEGGLALRRGDARVAAAVRRLVDAGIRVSLFIDPDRATIDRAAALGVPAIELHTGRYARNWRTSDAALRALARAASHARARGLAVHAGHGLTYDNVQPVAAIADIEELNIGHSIVSNAVFWGLEEAVRRMRHLVDEARKA